MSTKQPTSLVKFADADAAIRILSDARLRWSAPHLLHDPFELDHRSRLNFDSKGLLVACVKNTLGLIFSRDEPSGNSPLIKAIRRWRTEERFDSEDEATEVLTELLSSMVQHREPELLRLGRDWKHYSSTVRILCLSEGHENPLLWNNYGDRHTGVAIRLGCGEDTSLEKPMAVSYSDHKPEISTLNEQIDILMNQEEVEIQEQFPEKFLRKAKPQSKDKEWRLLKSTDLSPEDESKWYEDVEFAANEVRAVYFGAGILDSKKLEITKLLQKKYPKVKQFQAVVVNNRFELDFQRLNP